MPETVETLVVRPVNRMFTSADIHVRQEGDGRIVEAYAAVFGQRSEIMDQDGHYLESIKSSAFARTLNKGAFRNPVLFNHGRTVDGAPNPLGTMPIGVPIDVKVDNHGLWTATRYLDNPLADQVLDAIKQGAIRSQSFSGRFHKSTRSWPEGRARSALPLIERQEIELREYGPAVFAAYDGASILGTRQLTTFMRSVLALPEDQRLEWLSQFEISTSPMVTERSQNGSPEAGHASGATDTPDDDGLSDRQRQMRERISAFRTRHSLGSEKEDASAS